VLQSPGPAAHLLIESQVNVSCRIRSFFFHRHGQAHRGESCDESGEDHLQFDAGERGAEAELRTLAATVSGKPGSSALGRSPCPVRESIRSGWSRLA
jgi:hypothetical protein